MGLWFFHVLAKVRTDSTIDMLAPIAVSTQELKISWCLTG